MTVAASVMSFNYQRRGKEPHQVTESFDTTGMFESGEGERNRGRLM